MRYPPALTQLIRELGRLPGIGPKSAQRLAFYLFNQPEEDVKSLAEALLNAKGNLRQCERCFNITDQEVCSVCRDPGREQGLICVVEAPADLLAIERSGEYSGLYHVLHGALSPMNGVGPDQLTIQPLLARLGGVREVILATATTVEGEATAMYLARLLGELKVPTSRIAYGLPVGGDLEYADEVTLGRAISNRRPL
ncbi:recombination mediator RecR [Truepera radiovictrix]|uniref:Recombination protein RecR n=1 Tax=Truepera radiovictrix (strain DSM 17093 / CIP 108686 / LMG 22925 / RQ-24) TaxID=649638 RepID=D7CT22_TRURR|nr:recombination mediator RecR [Truepera radiovictrix]ADI15485.1 recombination protein RecR [Truepera radiovictrix DSM 17093]